MKARTFIFLCFVWFSCVSCQEGILVPPADLNGAWEDAGRDFSTAERIISTFNLGKANVIRLHSFVFFVHDDGGVIYTSDQAFFITEAVSLPGRRVKISCYPQGGTSDKLYTYVFRVIDDTTIQFMVKESSTPLFPARLKKGGEVYPATRG